MPDATSVLGVGIAREELITPGPAALLDADRAWQRLAAEFGPEAIGLTGFAFRPDRSPGGAWAGFPAVLIRVPALAVVRRRGRTYAVAAHERGEELLQLPRGLQAGPATAFAAEPALDPERWQAAVAAAAARLRAGEAEKVVLAREVLVHADGVLAAAAVARSLRAAYPSCFTYLFTAEDGTALVGASPELLIRRRGRHATSQPMAGSVARGADDAEDERLAGELLTTARLASEHAVVPAAVAAALEPFAESVERGRPEVVRFTNIQHLATTVRAVLRDPPASLLVLAAALHPTPAVGGRPAAAALAMIDELEALERGWYAGGVGWLDAHGDGEIAIAIRCGLLWEDGARLYAGNGIMPGSEPAAELAETEVKLRALMGALLF